MSAGEADGSGDAVAVFAQAFERRIGLHREIHLRAADEIVQIARRHFVALHGIDERGQNFRGSAQSCGRRSHGRVAVEVLLVAGDGIVESGAPFREAALFCGEIGAFVGDVVDEAHEGVESGEGIALRLGQEEKRVVEIAVGGARNAVAFGVGVVDRYARFGRACLGRNGTGSRADFSDFGRKLGHRCASSERPRRRACFALLMAGRWWSVS